ncbi:MAG: ABC transporter permease [Pseudomonadota bacterium]
MSLLIENTEERSLYTPFRADFLQGVTSWRLWLFLGVYEVRRRYRRTIIGPFWNTISLAVFVFVVGWIGAGLWREDVGEYMIFLCSGMLVWFLVAPIMNESTGIFIDNESVITNYKIEATLLAVVCVVRNLFVFAHNFLLYVAFCLFFGFMPAFPEVLLFIPGLVVLAINGIWVSLLIGLLCTRFRDIKQIITLFTSIAMFITPIFWTASKLESTQHTVFVMGNPLYHLLEIVRAPLLGTVPSVENYLAVLLITAGGFLLTFALYKSKYHRLVFWL